MTEIERNKKISAEYQRISVYFEDLSENEKVIISPLIQNASFMRITLEDLQEIIAAEGPIEAYQNGSNQSGVKQSAALQSYNATMKVYIATMKQLYGLLPPMKRPELPAIWKQPEKTDEERAEEEREREKDFALAVEYQRLQREEGLNDSFRHWKARMKERPEGAE